MWYSNVTMMTPAQKQQAYRDRQRQRAMGALPAPPAPCNIPPERRWATLRAQARAALQMLLDEMQAYHDDRSDEWQESDRGAAMADRLDALESVITDLDGIE
jgi:predicted acyl esterase